MSITPSSPACPSGAGSNMGQFKVENPGLAGSVLSGTQQAAARTKAGREKVATWLKYLESSNQRDPSSPMASYDFGWMWKELGVEDLRR